MKQWEIKAHRIVSELCLEEYKKVNAGKKRHKPYRVPELAQEILDCIKTDDEELCKYIFLTRGL